MVALLLSRRRLLAAAGLSLLLLPSEASSPNGDPALIDVAGARLTDFARQVKLANFLSLVQCGRRTRYVSGEGADENDGTRDRPFREIARAVVDALPGDLIMVGSGFYGHVDIHGFRGHPEAWLGIVAAPGSHPVVTMPPPSDNFVNVIDSSFVGLYGFEVIGTQTNPNTNGSGISVYGGSHHIALWNNYVHDFPGGGINCFDVDGSHDVVDIRFNRICRTSRFSPNNTSGISIFAPRDLTGGQTFEDGYGFRLVGNYVYDVLCTVPFTIGGLDYVTDGNGISLDRVLDVYGYRKPILVRDNVVTGCGGRAIHAFDTTATDIVNNTAIGNLRTVSPAISDGVEIDCTVPGGASCRANVILPMNTPNSTDRMSRYTENVILGGTQAVPPGNFDLRSAGLSYFRGPLSIASLIDGVTDPGVFAPTTSFLDSAVFSGSPAR